ncbi:MAG: MFS transporter [Bacteroidales bacterium]|nr:MFS transporter [Bacteroidales bacterium]
MKERLNLLSNRIKFLVHGFFFSTAYHIAEPSTILPLIVSYFSKNDIIIGIFSSLVRGGAIIMQLHMAFHAQAYKRVLNPLRVLFLFRLLSWTGIGLVIYLFGNVNPVLTLWLIGLGLFSFSFTAGLGTILFHELLGKVFTNEYRGVTWAYRQIFMGIGGILSGIIAGWIFNRYEKPASFAYAFLISALFMMIGYIVLGTAYEWEKKNISEKEKNFTLFISNTISLLKQDKVLFNQIIICLVSYSYLFSLPFVIKYNKPGLNLGGLALSSAVPLLTGSVLGNVFWAKLASVNSNKLIVRLSFLMMVISLSMALFHANIFIFILIFLLAGSAADGFRLAFKNLVLNLASEEKRPVYFAVQNFITSAGLFFSIPGGALLKLIGFQALILFTVTILLFGLFFSYKLKDI